MVLEKIGVTDSVVKEWRAKGIKISYPMARLKKYFKSNDGVIGENGDPYVVPLSAEETELYKSHPEKFREDFMKETKLFVEFLIFINRAEEKISSLKNSERLAILLSRLYLFQRAMDHHYFHFDRYLAYEDYPETPVGYWWEKLRKAYTKVYGDFPNEKPSADFLKLLSSDTEVLQKLKAKLSQRDFIELAKSLATIKFFERVQEEEVRLLIRNGEDLLVSTGMSLWGQLCEAIRASPELIKGTSKVDEIIQGHPILGVRNILIPTGIHSFTPEVVSLFENEINRWTF